MVVPNVTAATLGSVIRQHVEAPNSILVTDERYGYKPVGRWFAAHEVVNHGDGEYVRGNATTNHAEGYFSQLKRSLDGTHHHVSEVHLPRDLAEFDFRYSTRKMTDTDRLGMLVGRVGGRRRPTGRWLGVACSRGPEASHRRREGEPKEDGRDMDERFTVPPMPFEEAAKRLVKDRIKRDPSESGGRSKQTP